MLRSTCATHRGIRFKGEGVYPLEFQGSDELVVVVAVVVVVVVIVLYELLSLWLLLLVMLRLYTLKYYDCF